MATDSTKLLYGTNGYVTVNSTDLGHYLGDIEINLETKEYYPELSRAMGEVSGTGKITGGVSEITITLAEWQYAILSTLFSMGASSDANSEKIGSGALGTITELTNIVATGFTRNDNKPFRVTIPKGRATSPIAVTLAKAKESGLKVTFKGLFTDAAPSTMPGWIEIGK